MFKFAKHKSVLQKDGVMFLWVLKFSKKKKKDIIMLKWVKVHQKMHDGHLM